MTGLPVDPVEQLREVLRRLESLAPRAEELQQTRVVYRDVTGEEVIDDSEPVPQRPLREEDEQDRLPVYDELGRDEVPPAEGALPEFETFAPRKTGPVAAVDCGIVRLGETENGLVIALRATIVIDDGSSRVKLFRSGPIYLHNAFKTQLLHQMGVDLGSPYFFVKTDTSDPVHPRVVEPKLGVAAIAHAYGDRFRNWFERLVQKIAVASVQRGTVLFDGALTARTIDTPRSYLDQLGRLAGEEKNAIVAISKQSELQVQGRSVRFWLNDVPSRPGYRCLTALVREEGEERVIGNIHAARFSPLGPTFRMDVKSAPGQSDGEAIDRFYGSALMRGGYPDILVQAHAHSYFTSPDVIQLQAAAGAQYRFKPEPEVKLAGIFAPFGGRFK